MYEQSAIVDGVDKVSYILNEMVSLLLRMTTGMYLARMARLTYANGQGKFLLLLNSSRFLAAKWMRRPLKASNCTLTKIRGKLKNEEV